MEFNKHYYQCPELGPCPFCGQVLLVTEYQGVWDRDEYPDGITVYNNAQCYNCGLDLKGFSSNVYSSSPSSINEARESIKLKLLAKWSYRAAPNCFLVSKAEFKKDPEACLALRVFANVAVVSKANQTKKPLMYFKQLEG